MKYIASILFTLLFLNGCKSTETLKPVSQIQPGVASEGTLANQILIDDAIAGLQRLTGKAVNPSEVLKFVIQQPVGKVGSRAWREMWIIKSPDSAEQFLMTFKEAGTGAADFEIKPMNAQAGNSECPSPADDFKEGQPNTLVKSCLGQPDYIDQNPDGRYVYLYHRPNGLVVAYLFSPEDTLIRISVFQKSE